MSGVELPAVIARYYFNVPFAFYVIGYLAAAFAGTILVMFVKLTFRRDYQPRPLLTYEKLTGVVSRSLVLTAIILGSKVSAAFFLAAPVPELIRLYLVLSRRGDEKHYRDIYVQDVIISFVYAAAIGVALSFL